MPSIAHPERLDHPTPLRSELIHAAAQRITEAITDSNTLPNNVQRDVMIVLANALADLRALGLVTE